MSTFRSAFTLIELIVMIVVLGLGFATLPLILGIGSEAVKQVADVRAFYHGAAKVAIVAGKPWDERNVDDYQKGGIYYVLSTGEDTGGLVCDGDRKRSGHYPGKDRRVCEAALASDILGRAGDSDADAYDDIDDFRGDRDDEVEGYTVDTSVAYVPYVGGLSVAMPEGAAAGTTNIKQITVTVSERSGKVLTRYRYYAANIGRYKPYIRRNE